MIGIKHQEARGQALPVRLSICELLTGHEPKRASLQEHEVPDSPEGFYAQFALDATSQLLPEA